MYARTHARTHIDGYDMVTVTRTFLALVSLIHISVYSASIFENFGLADN